MQDELQVLHDMEGTARLRQVKSLLPHVVAQQAQPVGALAA